MVVGSLAFTLGTEALDIFEILETLGGAVSTLDLESTTGFGSKGCLGSDGSLGLGGRRVSAGFDFTSSPKTSTKGALEAEVDFLGLLGLELGFGRSFVICCNLGPASSGSANVKETSGTVGFGGLATVGRLGSEGTDEDAGLLGGVDSALASSSLIWSRFPSFFISSSDAPPESFLADGFWEGGGALNFFFSKGIEVVGGGEELEERGVSFSFSFSFSDSPGLGGFWIPAGLGGRAAPGLLAFASGSFVGGSGLGLAFISSLDCERCSF